MERRISLRAFALCCVILGISASDNVAFGRVQEPGGTPEAAVLALTKPHEYAWQLFFYLNRQAKSGVAGEPDESKRSLLEYDPDKDVVWETWALASGLDLDFSANKVITNKSEVFKNPATLPVAWEALERNNVNKALSAPFKSSPLVVSNIARIIPKSQIGPLIAPPGTDPKTDETRMNRSTYETVRSKNLYSVEGLEEAAAIAKFNNQSMVVSFEPQSKEVKARWIRLRQCDNNQNCTEKQRYHWRMVQTDGGQQVYGLVTLHIITKDLPNWFWSDFNHIDCEKPDGECAHSTVEAMPATTPLVDPTTKSTNGIRPETLNSKWQYYRLRGAQIDFLTSTGVDTILSNPVIENSFQRSSCITCHSNASVGIRSLAVSGGTSLPGFIDKKSVLNAGSQTDDTGRPKCQRFVNRNGEPFNISCPDIFEGQGKTIYFQTDFLWSLPFRAFSTNDQ